MLFPDLIRLTTSSFLFYRLRSFLIGLGIAVGIAAVILLTSIGEGLHQFVLAEFSQFGTNLIGIQPGKKQTYGASIGMLGSIRPLFIKGFHDEALPDEWKGHRSSRPGLQWRVIYRVVVNAILPYSCSPAGKFHLRVRHNCQSTRMLRDKTVQRWLFLR